MAEGAETVPDVAEGGPPEAPVQDAAGETDNTAAEATIEAENAAGEATGAAEILEEAVKSDNYLPLESPLKVENDQVKQETPAAAEVKTEEGTGKANGAPTPVPQLYKLFVGCIPQQLREDDVREYFREVGYPKEFTILRDMATGQSRGCAFAIYDDKAIAEAAIEKLDKKITLPGGAMPLEVRYARESHKVQPSSDPNDNNQLFFAKAPLTATEDDIKAVFDEFGEMVNFVLFMNRQLGTSKGCGFAFFKEKKDAEAAIEGLHDKRTLPGGVAPLTVKWADPNLHEKKRKAFGEPTEPQREQTQIFFARVPKMASEDDIRVPFAAIGTVKEVVLFKSHQSSSLNKGCGIVTMGSHDEAVKVLEQLDNKHTFEGMDLPMTVKWVDYNLQKRGRMDDDFRGPGYGGYGGGPWQGGGGGGWQGPGGYGGPGGYAPEEERPPPGCDPDAYKLYLAGLPKTWELDELRRVAEKFGQIIDMNLVRDKVTKEPKGVAFMWYRTRAQAEAAIRELDSKQFDDGHGGQRTLQVSRARPRRPPPGGPPPPGGGYARPPGGFQGGYGGRGQGPPPYQQPAYQQPRYQQPGGYYQQPAPAYGGYPPQQPQQAAYSYQPSYQQPPAPQYNYQQQPAYQAQPAGGYQAQAPQAYQQAYAAPAAPTAPAPAAGYAAPTGYEAQAAPAQQQAAPAAGAYGQQYAAPADQGGYSYGAPAAQQYAAPAQQGYAAAGASSGQYTYSAPAQAYQGYTAPPG